MSSMGMGVLCFSMALAYLPILLVAARKFALLYTLGSIFFISSFSFLYGPKKHFKETYWQFQTMIPFWPEHSLVINRWKASVIIWTTAIYKFIRFVDVLYFIRCNGNKKLHFDHNSCRNPMCGFDLFHTVIYTGRPSSHQVYGENYLRNMLSLFQNSYQCLSTQDLWSISKDKANIKAG